MNYTTPENVVESITKIVDFIQENYPKWDQETIKKFLTILGLFSAHVRDTPTLLPLIQNHLKINSERGPFKNEKTT